MSPNNDIKVKDWPQKLEKDMAPCHPAIIQISKGRVVSRVKILYVCFVWTVDTWSLFQDGSF